MFSLPHSTEEGDPFDAAEDYIYMPRNSNERFLAQKGLFTVHREPEKALENDALQKIILDKNCLVELGVTLLTYGISKGTLFPGLDGLCEDIVEKTFRY